MPKPLFAIGSTVSINGVDYEVTGYAKSRGIWEVILHDRDGKHISVPTYVLERQTK